MKQREEMISAYKKMLKNETSPVRIQSIEEALAFTEKELGEIKKLGGKAFGKTEPLAQETTIIETDKDSQTIKVTRIPKDPRQQTQVEITQDGRLIAPRPDQAPLTEEEPKKKGLFSKKQPATMKASESESDKPSDKKIDNKLRSTLQKEATKAAEESIQAKIAAAKAAKSSFTDNKNNSKK